MPRPEQRWIAALIALVPSLSLLTVLRHTREHLQADGVMQSVMSVQDPTLFFWGQDRFIPVVSWLAHPVSDPMANLWVCLLLEAGAFHGLLLVVARLVAPTISDGSWRSTTIVFLALATSAQAVLASATVSQFAIDTQPYSPSLLAALACFLLWRRGGWRLVPAAALAVVAVGLNPTAVLPLAALALAAALRTGQWWRWVALGVVCVASHLAWTHLATLYADPAIPSHKDLYAAFSPADYRARATQVAHRIVDALRLPWLAALGLVAAAVTASMPSVVRRNVLVRGTLVLAFAGAFTALFAGNAWVAANLGHARYFLPVFVAVLLVVAVPLAWLALRASSTPVVLVGLAGALVVAAWGPLSNPTRADVFTASQPLVDFANEQDIAFVSGDYWTVWPTLLPLLEDGRQSAYVAGLRSGTDPEGFRDLFERSRAQGPPRAICIDADPGVCAGYLTRWTAPGWTLSDQTCPDPVVPRPAGFESAIRLCVVLELRAGSGSS